MILLLHLYIYLYKISKSAISQIHLKLTTEVHSEQGSQDIMGSTNMISNLNFQILCLLV